MIKASWSREAGPGCSAPACACAGPGFAALPVGAVAAAAPLLPLPRWLPLPLAEPVACRFASALSRAPGSRGLSPSRTLRSSDLARVATSPSAVTSLGGGLAGSEGRNGTGRKHGRFIKLH